MVSTSTPGLQRNFCKKHYLCFNFTEKIFLNVCSFPYNSNSIQYLDYDIRYEKNFCEGTCHEINLIEKIILGVSFLRKIRIVR